MVKERKKNLQIIRMLINYSQKLCKVFRDEIIKSLLKNQHKIIIQKTKKFNSEKHIMYY